MRFASFRTPGHLVAVLLLACILSAVPAAVSVPAAHAAQSQGYGSEDFPDIRIPDEVKIEKDSDVTAAMFSRLFGQSWHEIAGERSSFENTYSNTGGLGIFSGLIVAILGVLNAAALVFVSVSVLYMWGIFAVTSAYEGKKLGGNIFHSLWFPVRHAFSFTLVVPVLNGLCLLQVAIIACLSLAINFANVVWDASGNYIIEHAHTGILDTSPAMLENDVHRALPIMFTDAVFQEVEMASMGADWDNRNGKYKQQDSGFFASVSSLLTRAADTAIETFGLGRLGFQTSTQKQQAIQQTWSQAYMGGGGLNLSSMREVDIPYDGSGNPSAQGLYIWRTNFANGKRYIFVKPPVSRTVEDLGRIVVSYPTSSTGTAVINQRDEDASYRKIADVRSEELTKMWEGMRELARLYLSSEDGKCVLRGKGCVSFAETAKEAGVDPMALVNSIMTDYQKNVMSRTVDARDQIMQDAGFIGFSDKNGKLNQAIDGGEKGSRYGWVSAGMFTFTLASLQKQIDDRTLTGITVHGRDKTARDRTEMDYTYAPELSMANLLPSTERLDKQQQAAINGAPGFFAKELAGDSDYLSLAYAQRGGGKDTLLQAISRGVANIVLFPSNNADGHDERTGAGLLGQTLSAFKSYDPIVVIQNIGDRILHVLFGDLMNFAVTAALSYVFGVGIALTLAILGATFAYLVPITPVIFWMRALMTWIYMAIEAMVAAPFWACVHAAPRGDGFAGESAKTGYRMLLNIVIRPTLLVLGAVFAIAIIQVLGWLFGVMFSDWFATVANGFINISVAADITFTVIVISFMYYISLTVFTQGVNHLPDRVLSWCGISGQNHGDEMGDTRNIIIAGGAFGKLGSHSVELGAGLGRAANLLRRPFVKNGDKDENGNPTTSPVGRLMRRIRQKRQLAEHNPGGNDAIGH